MTNKITPEAVKERIAALGSAGELSLKEQFYLEALRQLVAAMDSEPVADVVAWSHPTEERTCDIRWRRHDVEPGPLYRHAQPAPVVSEVSPLVSELPAPVVHGEIASAIEELKRTLVDCNRYNYCSDAVARVEGAYRAAMLQSRCSIQPAPALDFEPKTAEARSGNSPVIPDSCTWHCEEDINNWHSDCGYQFQFTEEGPEENGVKFCPKCGKSVAVSATEGTEE